MNGLKEYSGMVDIPLRFLQDEVRNGFFISTQVKQAWAAQLKVLSVVDNICKKYNISYFADWGTLLATVRHGGYIPWDDDIDICMKRADYIRFREVAKTELPKEFAIQDYTNQKDHWLFITRVVNKNQICYDDEHLNQYDNFPYIATVDIFLLDYLYRDKEKEKRRIDEIKKLLAIAEMIIENSCSSAVRNNLIKEVEYKYGINLANKSDSRKLGVAIYGLIEGLMAEVPDSEADEIGQIFPWILKGVKGYPKEYFEQFICLPYEWMEMPVPLRYNEITKHHYGNYMKIHKGIAGHDYPFFEGQRANLQKVADFKLPEFKINKNMINEKEKAYVSLKLLSEEVLQEVKNYHDAIHRALAVGDLKYIQSILPECQQIAIDYGTLVEKIITNEKMIISELENYCEALFGIYQCLTGEVQDNIQAKIEQLYDIIAKLEIVVAQRILNRYTVIFFPTNPENWNAMSGMHEQHVADDSCDVYVVPLPLYRKNIYGELTGEYIYDVENYPESVSLTKYDEFNLMDHYADIIYIQNAYDSENPVLTVLPDFYTKALKYHCDELIFVSRYGLADFGSKDICEVYNVKKFLNTPGIINADTIYVQTEKLKDRYIEILTEFAGDSTKEYWDNKIEIVSLANKSIDVKKDKKTILYCIGANELMEYGSENMQKAVKHRLNVFKEYSMEENMTVKIFLYPNNQSLWEDINYKLTNSIKNVLSMYQCDHKFSIANNEDTDDLLEECAAYYGAPSPIALLFAEGGKPVMLSSKDVIV